IVAIGDSFTFGLAVEMEESYPWQLESMLKEHGRPDIEVWNAGTPGHQMLDYLGTLRYLLPLTKPDLVLLEITMGDDVRPFPISQTLIDTTKVSGLARAY